MSASYRPFVQVWSHQKEGEKLKQILMPHVLLCPIRPDVVRFVHTNMAKNKRQPYAVSKMAGAQTSAQSWGTGRAVARIPRVAGGGTYRSGQAAFGNMCRGGRMFAPTKVWRRWHRRINITEKRFAMCSALAATAVPALVTARGHRIEKLQEIPLVIGDGVQTVQKTAEAIRVLKMLGVYDDIEKVIDSKKIRAGKGKLRNRRHVMRKGPLIVYNEDLGLTRGFRNIPGIDLMQVDKMNLLELAPGGHLGRFVIWTESAFAKLEKIYGSEKTKSEKKNFVIPRTQMKVADLARLINSDEIQSVVRPVRKQSTHARQHRNPLTNHRQMVKLNPYSTVTRRAGVLGKKKIVKKDAKK